MNETPTTSTALYERLGAGTYVTADQPFINGVGEHRTRALHIKLDRKPWPAWNSMAEDGSYPDGRHRTILATGHGPTLVLTDTIRVVGPLPDCCYREGTQSLLEQHRGLAHGGQVVYLDSAGELVVAR